MISMAKDYIERAKNQIESKSYEEFLMMLGSAEALATDSETLSEIYYLKAKGLFKFKKYEHAAVAIEEALKVTRDGKKAFKLLKAKALIFADQGHFRESLRLFKGLLAQSDDHHLHVEACIDIAWVMLERYRREPNNTEFDEIKMYLDTAYEKANEIDNSQKKRLVFSNYAEYFKIKKDYDMAIEMLEQVLPLCQESQLCEIYNDLAELYMEQ